MSSPRVRNRRACGLTPCASRRAHEPPRTPTPSDRDAPRHRGRRAGPVPRRSAVGGSRPGLGAARDRMGRARHRRPVPRGGGGLNVQRSTNRSLSHVANRPGMSGDRFNTVERHGRKCENVERHRKCPSESREWDAILHERELRSWFSEPAHSGTQSRFQRGMPVIPFLNFFTHWRPPPRGDGMKDSVNEIEVVECPKA
ncbi:MAG: hypothetical protein JWR32_3590 [Mycobacterium sp.]|nr:hypothetical protein [Mycobacterium sp.]